MHKIYDDKFSVGRYFPIKKYPPFSIDFVGAHSPLLAHALSECIAKLPELPDFGCDKSIAVFSDFAGDHKEAGYATYSFLFCSFDKLPAFEDKISRLRGDYNLRCEDEFSFKRIFSGAKKRALDNFLSIANSYVHGVLITFAVSKKIDTLFGVNINDVFHKCSNANGVVSEGSWNKHELERLARVVNFMMFMLSVLAERGHKIFWYCDNDSINQTSKFRSQDDITQMFEMMASLYDIRKDVSMGVAKSFEKKTYFDDLLSLTDISAGMVQELMTANFIGDGNIIGSGDKEEAKIKVLKWMAEDSKFLSKFIVEVVESENGFLSSRSIDLTPAK